MTDNQYQKPSPAYSLTVQLKIENRPGNFSRVIQRIASVGASLGEVFLISSDFKHTIRQITVHCISEEHQSEVLNIIKTTVGVLIIKVQDDTFFIHEGGKLNIDSKTALKTSDDLSRSYTPGVARVCNKIFENPELAYEYTIKNNTVAVVTDGSAVLGLGNIGPKAALPVMEGKATLFKMFGGLNAFPICLDTQSTEEIIKAVKYIAPGFSGINLEDISAPRCFEIEERLQQELDIPVFHDDQHGTAVVVLAGLINSMKLLKKELKNLKVVINGFGAGGVAIARLLFAAGVENIIGCDSVGIIYKGRKEQMNPIKEELLKYINKENRKGSIADALVGADVFIGVSKPGVISRSDVSTMNKDPIVFALANPTPEILPSELVGVAKIMATGRSDYANQVNNVLCFPGIFKGAIACRAKAITTEMKIAAAMAIAESVSDQELAEDFIIPSTFNIDVADRVAKKVMEVAIAKGLAGKVTV